MGNILENPLIIPLGAFVVAIVAILAGVFAKAHADRLRAEQRMALLGRGLSVEEVERILAPSCQQVMQSTLAVPPNSMRVAAGIRLTALICIFSGLGVAAFFSTTALVVRNPRVFAGAGTALIPILVGVGFWVDYRARVRDAKQIREEAELSRQN